MASRGSLTVEDICDIHRALLDGTRLAHLGGVVRTQQNWIGGNRVNPVGAAYVPPVPEEVPDLLRDLVAFIGDTDLPSVAVTAIAHAQFETIHPFADGNGRTGRALVHALLRLAGLSRTTVPPVSLVLATDRERYIANLAAYRTDVLDDRQAAVNGWVEYFANILTLSCRKAGEFERSLEAVKKHWLETVPFRVGSAGRQLIDLLPGTPVISMKTAQKLTGKSYPAVRTAVLSLENAGILR